MAYHSALTFPATLAYGCVGGPRYHTQIIGAYGGAEQRNRCWASPLWQWQVGLVNKDVTTTRTLIAFFRLVHGMRDSFNFAQFLPGQGTSNVQVRFDSDTLPIVRVDVETYSWESIMLVQVRA